MSSHEELSKTVSFDFGNSVLVEKRSLTTSGAKDYDLGN